MDKTCAFGFDTLFAELREAGYAWQPLTPERLQKLRRQAAERPGDFDPRVLRHGLGMESGPAVSRVGDYFVPHHHWSDASAASDFVYLGRESLELISRLEKHHELLRGRSGLDLGSGAGALSIALADVAGRMLGLELSEAAVNWASAAARAQGLANVRFRQARVGEGGADLAVTAEGGLWDFAVFNPPMAVPNPGQYRPFRDGGRLGIEIPLMFLDFARRHLRPEGDVFCLLTSPCVGGRSLVFDSAAAKRGFKSGIAGQWEVLERALLDDRFNQALYRKEGYSALGIERVELWYVHLRKAV
jgi:methylase of polypeptide subunit release factors